MRGPALVLVAFAVLAARQDAGRNLLRNPGFEQADPLEWIVAEGAPVVHRVRVPPAFPGPVDGQRYLGGGRGPQARVVQTVALDGGGTLRLRGEACSGLGGDTVRIDLLVGDADGQELARGSAPITDRMDWAAFQCQLQVPASARQATVTLRFARQRGEDLNAFVDALVLEWLDRTPASQPASRPVAASQPVGSAPASIPAAPPPAVPVPLPPAVAARARLLAGPALYQPDTGQMLVWWESDSDAPQAVVAQVLGAANAPLRATSQVAPGVGAPPRFVHQARFTELVPGAHYRYALEGQSEAFGTFLAPPAPGAGLTFAVIGDNQEHPDLLRTRVLSRLLADGVPLLVHAGDVVGQGDLPEHWRQHWYGPLQPFLRQLPVLIARGNHDGESPLARQKLPLPGTGSWYAATLGCVRFVVLDSNLPCGPDSPQLRWLAAELQAPATRAASWRVAVFHHPPWTNTWDARNYDGDVTMRTHAVPLLEGQGGGAPCDLVLSGHAHCYNRGQRQRPDGRPVFYVISGGGGGYLDSRHIHDWPHIQVEQSVHHYLLVTATPAELRVRALQSQDRREIDAFTLSR